MGTGLCSHLQFRVNYRPHTPGGWQPWIQGTNYSPKNTLLGISPPPHGTFFRASLLRLVLTVPCLFSEMLLTVAFSSGVQHWAEQCFSHLSREAHRMQAGCVQPDELKRWDWIAEVFEKLRWMKPRFPEHLVTKNFPADAVMVCGLRICEDPWQI